MDSAQSRYEQLVQLFDDWRQFESPPRRDGAPDYSEAQFRHAAPLFDTLQQRLRDLSTEGFTPDQRVDYQIVQAELNGYDFNTRVLKPWQRDPAYYQSLWMEQSDVPAHEGPCHHAIIDVWLFRFPLSAPDDAELTRQLLTIPPLLEQARDNLKGNARDLWHAGIKNFEQQQRDFVTLQNRIGLDGSEALKIALHAALHATQTFTEWLREQAPHKTGASGIGIDDYNWYQQHVHLVPLDWQQQVFLMQRELNRAWCSLKLEEQRNQHLPPLNAVSTPEEWVTLADASATKLMNFLRDKNVMPIKPNMEPALREHLLDFVPEQKRHFFDICRHYNPLPQYCHWYHWFDLAQMRDEPHTSPIRRGPLLYNIWDSRNEGIATGVEEMFMHLGLHDDNPRVREIVWVMLAQRAARGLASLYVHANQMTMSEAMDFHTKNTPRGWMDNSADLAHFEQQLYLRQPGYGTSYVVGKYLIEGMMREYFSDDKSDGGKSVFGFVRWFNEVGCVPVKLI